jgi:hypothetical protein
LRKIALGILFSLTIICTAAQTVKTPVAAIYTRLGTYTSNYSDVFSFKNNQAALANISSFTGGLYGEKRFLLQELSLYEMSIAVPTTSGNFGLTGSYFGNNQNNETGLGFAYGRNLGSKVSVGAQFNYYSVQVAGYGSASSVNFEAGILLHINEQLHTGLHVYNPTGSNLNKGDQEKLPSIYNAGIGYEVSNRFFITAEIEKVEDKPVSVNGGMQYSFDEKLFARTGFASGSSVYYFGLGLALQSFRLDATASIHPQLGVTPGLMLIFKKKEQIK